MPLVDVVFYIARVCKLTQGTLEKSTCKCLIFRIMQVLQVHKVRSNFCSLCLPTAVHS